MVISVLFMTCDKQEENSSMEKNEIRIKCFDFDPPTHFSFIKKQIKKKASTFSLNKIDIFLNAKN